MYSWVHKVESGSQLLLHVGPSLFPVTLHFILSSTADHLFQIISASFIIPNIQEILMRLRYLSFDAGLGASVWFSLMLTPTQTGTYKELTVFALGYELSHWDGCLQLEIRRTWSICVTWWVAVFQPWGGNFYVVTQCFSNVKRVLLWKDGGHNALWDRIMKIQPPSAP